VQDVLDSLVSLADCPIPVERDPSRMRPADEPVLVGDNARLRALGWAPSIPVEETLAALLAFERSLSAPREVHHAAATREVPNAPTQC